MPSFPFAATIFLCLILFSHPNEALQVSGLTHLENLNPGQTTQVKIRIFNDQPNDDTIELNLVDYSCNDKGEHFFDEPSADGKYRSNTRWIHLGQSEIFLREGESRDVSYTIQVPADPTLKGSYWSVLLIEPKEPLPVKDDGKEGLHLQVKIRYAHHIIVNVGEGEAKLKIIDKEKRSINGKNYLVLHVVNEGNLFFDPSVTLKIYDSQGKITKTLQSGPERLYPQNPQAYLLPFDDLPDKNSETKIKGFIIFDDGEKHLFGDQFNYP